MATQLSEDQSQQYLRTIEMFEAITESQPDDYQSLEILKEAYAKLGRKDESLAVSKKLAKVYLKLGQISQAILEYEGIAQEYPGDPDAAAALAELATKTSGAPTSTEIQAPSLAEDSKPQPPPAGVPAGAPVSPSRRSKPGDGDRALGEVLVAEKTMTDQALEPLLQKLQELRANNTDHTQPLSLIPLLVQEQLGKLEDLLTILVEKSKLPFLPLASYDVDRETACLVPQDICWEYCLVPFDLISRSVLIATANPFDKAARQLVEAMLDYNVFWYVAAPAEIAAALRQAHGMNNARNKPVKS
jgi:tetratricopeptide (TPR) repeat protein